MHRITSEYKIFAGEWDGRAGRILLPPPSSPRYAFLVSLKAELQWELDRLRRMTEESEKTTGKIDIDEIVSGFSPYIDTQNSVFNFIRCQIRHKRQLGKVRSSETYRSMLNSLMHFRNGRDMTFDMVDGGLMELYEAWMLNAGMLD